MVDDFAGQGKQIAIFLRIIAFNDVYQIVWCSRRKDDDEMTNKHTGSSCFCDSYFVKVTHMPDVDLALAPCRHISRNPLSECG